MLTISRSRCHNACGIPRGHWFVAGVTVTRTGFVPDHLVANLFHAVNLDGIRNALPAIDVALPAIEDKPLIAVLPFVNLSSDPGAGVFRRRHDPSPAAGGHAEVRLGCR